MEAGEGWAPELPRRSNDSETVLLPDLVKVGSAPTVSATVPHFQLSELPPHHPTSLAGSGWGTEKGGTT